MSLSRVCTGPRLFVGALAAITLFTYYQSQFSSPTSTMGDETPLNGLKLSLAHVSGSSPPALTAILTNDNTVPVTLLSYDSPLDPLSLQLGFLSILPDGKDEPIEVRKLHVRRIWPPTIEQLITLAPGESARNEIVIKPMVVSPEYLGPKATFELKGKYQAVWLKDKHDIDPPSLQDPRSSPGAVEGSFTSGKVDVKF